MYDETTPYLRKLAIQQAGRYYGITSEEDIAVEIKTEFAIANWDENPNLTKILNTLNRRVLGVTPQTIDESAAVLQLEPRLFKAVAKVESGAFGFTINALPLSRFEMHLFKKQYPSLSHEELENIKKADSTWTKIRYAMSIAEPDLALKSTSFGAFQILGSNFKAAGFKDVYDMVDMMSIHEDNQYKAFTNFLLYHKLHIPLQQKDYSAFALRYNGKLALQRGYHTKIAQAYDSLA